MCKLQFPQCIKQLSLMVKLLQQGDLSRPSFMYTYLQFEPGTAVQLISNSSIISAAFACSITQRDYSKHKVPDCLHDPLSELGHPTPPPASECVSPLDPKGGKQHSLAGEGVGEPNSDDQTESLALCILRVVYILPYILILYTLRSAACTVRTL